MFYDCASKYTLVRLMMQKDILNLTQASETIYSDDLVLYPIARQPHEKKTQTLLFQELSCIQHERIYLIAGLTVCKFSGRQLHNYEFTNE